MTTPARPTKDGVVLSGGGAKGAYEIGILKALFAGQSPATDRQPLEVEIVTGTSVGAYNGAFLVSQTGVSALEAVTRLEKIWCERIANTALNCGNGVFRLRDGPLSALDPGCFIRPFGVAANTFEDAGFWTRYLATRSAEWLKSAPTTPLDLLDTVNVASAFDPQPLYELINETVDRDGLKGSDKSLTVAATDWHKGRVRLFSRVEIAGAIGLRAIAASVAIPGIFPPVEIDDIPFQDGGVLLNTPLKPAIREGAEVIHVIFLDPRTVNIPLPEVPNTIDTVYRMFLITSSALLRADIERATSIQRELEWHRNLGILTRDFRLMAKKWLDNPNSRVLRRLKEGKRPYRPLTIHFYRPKNDLGGGVGLLDFSGRFIEQLIAEGYRDAVEHDCQASGCLLPKET